MTAPKTKYYKEGYLVKNLENDQVVFVSTVAQISDMVPEVSRMTIIRYIRLGGVQRISTTPFLLKQATDQTPWEKYSEARSYRASGPQRKLSARPVKCLDIDTNKITHYTNPGHAVEAFGLGRALIYQSLARGSDNACVGLVDSRWVFRFADHAFPEVERDDLKTRFFRTVPQQVLVKFLKTGEVVRYRNRAKCLQELGLSMAEFKRVALDCTQKVSKPGVLLKPVYDETPWLS